MTDISHRFALGEVDHRELLEIFTLRYQTCWRVGKGKIAFLATKDHKLRLEMRHGQIARIWAGQSLSSQELNGLLEQVEADLKDNRIAEFGAEILFAHRPVKGALRFEAVQMQILPPPSDAPVPQQMMAEPPFVLEYPIQAFRTPELRNKRHRKNAFEWTWVLNALLHGSIKCGSVRPRQMWAIKSAEAGRPFWAQEFYIVPGFSAFREALSDLGAIPLPVVAADTYFGGRQMQIDFPIDEFFVPDNLNQLISAFVKLDGDGRRRFLRSAVAVYIAQDLWEVSISSFLLACVQAVETLVDRPTPRRCPTCGKDAGPGPTRLFREFVERYCLADDVGDQRSRMGVIFFKLMKRHGR